MHISSKIRRVFLRLVVVLFLSFIITGCNDGIPATLDEAIDGEFGMLVTGPTQEILRMEIPANGSTVLVEQPDSPIHGLMISIPHDSYETGFTLTVSYASIREHRYHPLFNPITPLIRIANGGLFAHRPMRLRIPIDNPDSLLPVAFYYDKADGSLEPLAPLEYTATYLDVMIRHFSDIVVSAIPIEALHDAGGYDMGFEPELEAWAFNNWPTHVSRNGICAGMSIGAVYYHERFRGVPRITERFDNDRYQFRTPDVWHDDIAGFNVCSSLQRVFDESSSIWTTGKDYSPLDPIWAASARDQFWSVCYALAMTNRPQSLLLRVRNDATKPVQVVTAHAYHIDYARSIGRLLVYDPNNIFSKRNEIRFALESNSIGPFTTATNAVELQYGITTEYDEIRFVPLSTLCDIREIDRVWKSATDRIPSTGSYAEYDVYAVPSDNSGLPRVKLLDASSDAHTNLPFMEFTIEVEARDPNLQLSAIAFTHSSTTSENTRVPWKSSITLERPDGDNLIGVFVMEFIPKPQSPPIAEAYWIGFRWYNARHK